MKTILLTLFASLILIVPVEARSIAGNWSLSSMQFGKSEAQAITVPITLNISQDAKIGGKGGCNSYGGSYLLKKNNQVEFKNIISTKMYCEGTSELEDTFFQSLQGAKTAKIKNGKLILENKEKGILLIFEKRK
jgi:heat shock protein HslJ